ncbi:hypothetical protein NLI96_g4678 [Meripilus lineatus]|uniref:F-box domain-containing protein n=1 Tax=Meripilus lineatus TaxID=2056292 RepID=A0AAD5V9G0_9APHY|nr:hypothetical protein NLI96_g4678 [Physisporinus lineatus]
MLFSTFSIELPSPTNPAGSQKHVTRLQRFHQRLEFFSSDGISSMVRHIAIRRDLRHGTLRSFVDNWQWDIFEKIVQFRNVRSVVCEGLILTASNVRQLVTLPWLTHLVLRLCSVHVPMAVPGRCISRLKSVAVDDDNGRLIEGYTLEWWTSTVSQSTLERVNCTPRSASATLLSLLASGPGAESLRELRFHYLTTERPDFLGALANCPNVVDFGLVGWPRDSDWMSGDVQWPSPDIFPRLRSITGPYQHVMAYSKGRPISRITIVDPLPDKADGYVTRLYDHCPALTHFCVNRTRNGLFVRGLLARFRALEVCDIRIRSLDDEAVVKVRMFLPIACILLNKLQIYTALANVDLPNTLERVTITSTHIAVSVSSVTIPNFPSLSSEALHASCPQLQCLVINGDSMCLDCSRSRSRPFSLYGSLQSSS